MSKITARLGLEIFVFESSQEISNQNDLRVVLEIDHIYKGIRFVESDGKKGFVEKQYLFRDPLVSKIVSKMIAEATEFAVKRIKEVEDGNIDLLDNTEVDEGPY